MAFSVQVTVRCMEQTLIHLLYVPTMTVDFSNPIIILEVSLEIKMETIKIFKLLIPCIVVPLEATSGRKNRNLRTDLALKKPKFPKLHFPPPLEGIL